MKKGLSFRFGIVCILLGIIFLALSPLYFSHLVEFFRVYISDDQVVTSLGIRQIRFLLFAAIVFWVGIGLFFVFNVGNWFLRIFQVKQVAADVKRVFFDDPVSNYPKMGKYYFWASSLIALGIQLAVIIWGEPEWEGTTDKNSSALFAVAVLILLASLVHLRKLDVDQRLRSKIRWGVIVSAFLFFFLYGEEVNWGQQYFEIKTTSFFEMNFQQENSVHNFFNPLFSYVYAAAGMGVFMVLTYFWFVRQSNGWLTKLFVPPVAFLIFFLSMAGTVYTGESDELYEAYLAVFSVLYSLRIFWCLKNPNKSLMLQTT